MSKNPKNYFFSLPRDRKPTNLTIPEVLYPNIQKYWDKCTSKRIFNPIFGVKAIVIHATAGYASSHVIPNMTNGVSSWHWLIPDEDEPEHGKIVWACVPETLAAWHVRNSCFSPDLNNGQNKINHWSLGIEIVNSQIEDPFSDWQVKITADIVKYCWAKYPNLEYVVSHAKLDPTRRSDPGVLFPWEEFKSLVLNNDYSHLLIYENLVREKGKEKMSSEVVKDICC